MKKLTKKIVGTIIASVSTLAVIFTAFPVAAVSKASVAFHKSSLSQYTSQSKLRVTEQLLWDFESSGSYYTLDSSDSTQGSYSGKVSLSSNKSNCYLFSLTNKFSVNASDKKKVTFKVDIWVNDMSLVAHDHEAGYPQNDYTHFGTLYWRLKDKNGRTHGINTSVSDNEGKGGWQTMEFSLLHDNGKSSSFDYSNITGSFIYFNGRAGVTVRVDNLRVCYYSNSGYTADNEGIPSGSRVVSRCDADALDGAVISEWYGTSFDFTHQMFGSSCLAYKACTVDDYRIFFGEYDFSISQSADYICFWLWLPKGAEISRWFMEANYTQDNGNEFENPNWSVENLTKHAVDGFKTGEWNLLQVPLSALKNNNNGRDSLNLEHFRMVLQSEGDPFTVYFDNIYFCNATQKEAAAKEFRELKTVSSIVSSKPVSSSASSEEVSSADESLAGSDGSSDEGTENVTSDLSDIADGEPSDTVTSAVLSADLPQNDGKGFPVWGYIAIATAVAVVAGGVIILLIAKKRKSGEEQ